MQTTLLFIDAVNTSLSTLDYILRTSEYVYRIYIHLLHCNTNNLFHADNIIDTAKDYRLERVFRLSHTQPANCSQNIN